VEKGDGPKFPAWTDEMAVVDYVSRAINCLLNDPDNIDQYGLAIDRLFDKLPSKVARAWLAQFVRAGIVSTEANQQVIAGIENEAVQAANEGNYFPLGCLTDPTHPLNSIMTPPIRTMLAPSTYALITEVLYGRRIKPKHRPRLTDTQRRAQNPIHDAADAVPMVESLLRQWYPEQTAGAIHERALHVVAYSHKVPLERLIGYLRRSKADRRRL
jgi:hypothetical protein